MDCNDGCAILKARCILAEECDWLTGKPAEMANAIALFIAERCRVEPL